MTLLPLRILMIPILLGGLFLVPTGWMVPQSSMSQAQAQLTKTLKFKLANDTEAFSLKPKEDGAKLVNALEQEIARLKWKDNKRKLQIRDPRDQTLGFITITDRAWKISGSDQKERYVLRLQPDGDYKLETATDQPVYRIKKRDYGYEIQTPTEQTLYKIKQKGDKLSLRNAADQTTLSTKDPTDPVVIMCFGLDVLSPPEKAALAVALSQTGR